MKCRISVTPVKGKVIAKEVEVKDGQTIKEVLEANGLKADGDFVVMMNGVPAKLDDKVSDAVNISLTEKAAGS